MQRQFPWSVSCASVALTCFSTICWCACAVCITRATCSVVHSTHIYFSCFHQPDISQMSANRYTIWVNLKLSSLSYSYQLVTMLSVCLSVWMLTRVPQIVTAAHRDLWSCMHRPTNEPWSQIKNQVELTYFTGQNCPKAPKRWHKKVL